ncbi:unnamed protein product [Gongylonema pulchrum]|uniref:Metalloproteinase inhibitor 1 n=1 Tax=Gongylonema pulchrum TaxID=637853 RepID=A0A183DZ83_9BILA|nr:unnamed protein product [Gongylonema pulchrum]
MPLQVILLLLLLVGTATARPPTADEAKEEVREQQVNDSKDDYDTLPALEHIPESLKESLKKQKLRYLNMLQQHNL